MGCAFCASALHGLVRNLTAGEMLSQVYEAERVTGEKINHIVVMGMGEPFDNYENLRRFLELLHHKDGKNMSYRHMTVSTSGILPGIRRFAEDFPQANLGDFFTSGGRQRAKQHYAGESGIPFGGAFADGEGIR